MAMHPRAIVCQAMSCSRPLANPSPTRDSISYELIFPPLKSKTQSYERIRRRCPYGSSVRGCCSCLQSRFYLLHLQQGLANLIYERIRRQQLLLRLPAFSSHIAISTVPPWSSTTNADPFSASMVDSGPLHFTGLTPFAEHSLLSVLTVCRDLVRPLQNVPKCTARLIKRFLPGTISGSTSVLGSAPDSETGLRSRPRSKR
jgi:hypothetical protein